VKLVWLALTRNSEVLQINASRTSVTYYTTALGCGKQRSNAWHQLVIL
jgi:hypothetical protein